jgi:DeoR/GlpR family transcriptional regulator of sugar metabolism
MSLMKNNRAFIENRRRKIYQMLEQHGSVKVEDLSAELHASPLTIRRDLDHLEQLGFIERFYGGATLRENSSQPSLPDSDNALFKHAIAQRAVQFIADGDIIFINSSSTALLMLNYITAKMVTVITNNGRIMLSDYRDNVSIVLTGGELRVPKKVMVGEFALNNLNRVTATKSFLGCSGLTAEEGFTTANMHEVAINQLMLSRVTGERYILADHTKIGKKHNFISGSPDQISCVITDTEADKTVLDSLAVRGIQIIQVPPLKQET